MLSTRGAQCGCPSRGDAAACDEAGVRSAADLEARVSFDWHGSRPAIEYDQVHCLWLVSWQTAAEAEAALETLHEALAALGGVAFCFYNSHLLNSFSVGRSIRFGALCRPACDGPVVMVTCAQMKIHR